MVLAQLLNYIGNRCIRAGEVLLEVLNSARHSKRKPESMLNRIFQMDDFSYYGAITVYTLLNIPFIKRK